MWRAHGRRFIWRVCSSPHDVLGAPPWAANGGGISILSYNNSVTLAVVSDAHLMPDPEIIAERFGREFDWMLELSRQATLPQAAPTAEESPATEAHCAAITKQGSHARTGRWLARSTVARTSQ